MKDLRKFYPLLIILTFSIVAFIFFSNGIVGGMSIKGSDSNYSVQNILQTWIKHGSVTRWDGNLGIGDSGNNLLSVYIPVMKALPLKVALSVSYLISMILTFIFMFLFLRDQKLELLASAFGAIAFAFSPHFISLIYGGHMTIVEMPAIIALLLYFTNLVFFKEAKSWVKWIAVIPSGVVWGILLSQEVQRGFYISVALAIYLLFLIKTRLDLSFKEWKKAFKDKRVYLEAVKLVLIAVLLFLTSFHSLRGWLSFAKVDKAEGIAQVQEKSPQEKWEWSTMWSYHPAEIFENLAWGFFGKESGNPETPYWGHFEYYASSEVLGFFVLIFMLLAIALHSHKKKHKILGQEFTLPHIDNATVRIFFWIGLIALLLSMGRYLPGRPLFWLYFKIPFMDKFRIPVKFLAVTAFSWVVVAAYGMQALKDLLANQESEKIVKKVWKGSLILLGLGIIILLSVLMGRSGIMDSFRPKLGNYSSTAADNLVTSSGRMILWSSLFALLMTVFVFRSRFKSLKPGILWLIIPVMLIEMWTVDKFYLNKSYFNADEFYAGERVVDILKAGTPGSRHALTLLIPNQGRIASIPLTTQYQKYKMYDFIMNNLDVMDISGSSRGDDLVSNMYMQYLIRSIGLNGIQTLDDILNMDAHLFQMTGTRYIITDGYLYAGQQPMVILYNMVSNDSYLYLTNAKSQQGRDHFIFEVKDVIPRLALYEGYIISDQNEQDLYSLADPGFDYQHYLIVQGTEKKTNATLNKFKEVPILEMKPWSIRTEVDTLQESYVLHNIRYSTAWQPYIDGIAAPLEKANYLMQAVKVPAGKHTVEFRFEPDQKWAHLSKYMVWLASFSVLLLSGLGIVSFIKNKKGADE